MGAGLVVEYDGDDHRPARRHSSDVDREALFRRHRLEVTRVTGPDLADRAKVVRRLHGGRALARFEAPSRRTWTLVPPPWWRGDEPVDDRIDRRERRLGAEYCCPAGIPAAQPVDQQ